jgi:DnaJ-class molecular chaperone
MSHYETLGVAKDFDPDDLKKKYRKLASAHHPDKGGDTKKFQEIQTAYDTLSDPNKRQQYDLEQSGGGRNQFRFNHSNFGGGFNQNDMFDILRQQFGFGPGQFRSPPQQPQKNRDIKIALEVNLIDTLTEQLKTLNVTLPGNNAETIEIKVPRGIPNGANMRYTGLGSKEITTVPRGDLYVEFRVRPHPEFDQNGIDLYKSISIDCFEAILGCSKEVTGIDGSIFKLTIPAGTQMGRKLGIPNAGVFAHNSDQRGRLIISVDITIPTMLDLKQLELVKQVQESIKKE